MKVGRSHLLCLQIGHKPVDDGMGRCNNWIACCCFPDRWVDTVLANSLVTIIILHIITRSIGRIRTYTLHVWVLRNLFLLIMPGYIPCSQPVKS